MGLPSVPVPSMLTGHREMTLIEVTVGEVLLEVLVVVIIWRVTDMTRFVLTHRIGNRLCCAAMNQTSCW